MEGIQGAVLRVKLRHLERWTEARRSAAARYDALFAGSGVATPWAAADSRHVYHLYVVRSGNRQAWQDVLAAQGHPDRDPLPDAGAPAAAHSPISATARGSFRIPSARRTKCCRCRCFRS